MFLAQVWAPSYNNNKKRRIGVPDSCSISRACFDRCKHLDTWSLCSKWAAPVPSWCSWWQPSPSSCLSWSCGSCWGASWSWPWLKEGRVPYCLAHHMFYFQMHLNQESHKPRESRIQIYTRINISAHPMNFFVADLILFQPNISQEMYHKLMRKWILTISFQ